MTLTSRSATVFLLTYVCGLTVRSAVAVSLALHVSESSVSYESKTDRIDEQNTSAQHIIVDTLRHLAEEYDHQGDRSRGRVSAWVCITIVASISALAVRWYCCTTAPCGVEQLSLTARWKATGSPARPSARPKQSSGPSADAPSVTNDRLA
mmetsp:Transcript_10015/g.26737  ORF Transcript_10015/g.26737 Transcript_10015/m.26737 type:complete len:151 (-) Transcript_10015:7-459(-)